MKSAVFDDGSIIDSEKRRGLPGNEEATGRTASGVVRQRHPDAALPPHILASIAGILLIRDL